MLDSYWLTVANHLSLSCLLLQVEVTPHIFFFPAALSTPGGVSLVVLVESIYAVPVNRTGLDRTSIHKIYF